MREFRLTPVLGLAPWLAGALVIGAAGDARAQVGSGWTRFSPSSILDFQCGGKHTHYPVGNRTVNGAASYNASGGVETFRLLNNGCNRVERRADEHYRSGKRQMQGDLNADQLSAQSVHQLFHGTTGPFMMIRGYTGSGGTLRKIGGNHTLATGIFGRYIRYNSIHRVGSAFEVYINGTRKYNGGGSDGNSGGFNNKYGLYGTKTTSAPIVRWRNVQWYR